jgi:DNA gyrase/topoisomerase IV subunit A
MELNLCDKQYNYKDISYNFIIISLLIIYSISIVLFFIKQLVKDIKKKLLIEEEKLLDIEEKELLTTEEKELLTTEEKELLDTEEELLTTEEELLTTEEEELLTTEEELLTTEEELLANEEKELLTTEEELLANEEKELLANEEKELLDTEEELLLANYNKKQRALALQEAYKEKLNILLKKKNEINIKLDNFNRCGYNLFFNTNNNGLSESVINKIILLRMIHTNISKSISNEMPSSEEILRIAKKAGVFDSPYDILDLLKIRTNAFDNGHPFYDEYKEVLSKI